MAKQRLYIILRDDLTPGRKLAQTSHLSHAFSDEHKAAYLDWKESSNTVKIMEAPHEEIATLKGEAQARGILVSEFIEPEYPDYGGPIVTGIVVAPCGGKLVERRKFKMAGLNSSCFPRVNRKTTHGKQEPPRSPPP